MVNANLKRDPVSGHVYNPKLVPLPAFTESEHRSMTAYKVVKPNMEPVWGERMKYEVGQTYRHDGDIHEFGEGFHACQFLCDVFAHTAARSMVMLEVSLVGLILHRTHTQGGLGIGYGEPLPQEEVVAQELTVIRVLDDVEINAILRREIEEGWNCAIWASFNHVNGGKNNIGKNNTGSHNQGSDNRGDKNDGLKNRGDRNAGNGNRGDRNTGHQNNGDQNTGDSNHGSGNQGDNNHGDRNVGSNNRGDFNHTNFSWGIACTRPTKIPCFDGALFVEWPIPSEVRALAKSPEGQKEFQAIVELGADVEKLLEWKRRFVGLQSRKP